MLEPVKESLHTLRDMIPTDPKKWRPNLNFITVHYIYMIGMSIIASIILFPGKLSGGTGGVPNTGNGGSTMAYIDSLFFGAGAATQSGLNTLDVNKLLTYQQVVLMMVACLCNPVIINTVVVFIRLYWFEKRFNHIVQQEKERQKSFRRARTFTKSKSQAKADHEALQRRLEEGVSGKPIEVLRDTLQPGPQTPKTMGALKEFGEKQGLEHLKEVGSSEGSSNRESKEASDTSGRLHNDQPTHGEQEKEKEPDTPASPTTYMGLNPRLNREIAFADEVKKPLKRNESDDDRLPGSRDVSSHIAFVERQKQERIKGTGTLRIPGPRDYDEGKMPTELEDEEDENALNRSITRNTLRNITSEQSARGRSHETGRSEEMDHADEQPVRKGITIDIPDNPRHARSQAISDTTEADEEVARHRFDPRRIATGLRHRAHSMNLGNHKTHGKTFSSLTTVRTNATNDPTLMPYLSWQATIGRNSAFVGLTQKQREELGGIEYRALKTLAKILIGYFVGFHVLGMMVLLPWILYTPTYRDVVVADGQSPGWWGVFTPASMFNDLGFTLTPDSMISFQTATLPLLFGSFLIVIGNTGFPVMLRFTIWVVSVLTPNKESPTYQELRFLLDHPRRCFTLLFPSKATWWLFWILVLLNSIDLVFFIILDLNDETVTSLAPGYRVLDGWFQATSTRTAGFAAVNLADLHPAIQVSYMIMMYISVFPIAISVRRTNVYEEKSLGIWGGEEEGSSGGSGDADPSYVGQHLRRQLSFDLWYIFLGFFIICIVEGGRLQNINEYAFTMFSVLFEIISAYGTVGLSLGYPTINASFSAEFAVISKLVIIAMMIRGRHRGLPYALDRAILLPSESLHKKEAEDANHRHIARRGSVFAEGNEDLLRRRTTWEDAGDADENGLPRQHTFKDRDDDPMAAGAGGDFRNRRRMSTASQGGTRHQRGRSLSRVIASGLSAGPTFSKHEHE